jgi:hypothetical protein
MRLTLLLNLNYLFHLCGDYDHYARRAGFDFPCVEAVAKTD